METSKLNSRNLLERGVKSLLEEHKVPFREHLKVVQALKERIDRHEQDLATHRKLQEVHLAQIKKHEKDRQVHLAQLASYDDEVKRLHTLPHIKGEKGDAGTPGRNGRHAELQTIVNSVLPLIPTPKDGARGKDAKFDIEKLFTEFIQRIQTRQLIDISHIKNAQTFLFKGKKYKTEELMHGGGSSSSSTNFVYNEVVSGSGTSWVLAHTPTTNTLQLFANGQRLTPTVDYSLSGKNITTVLSWSTGTLLADYQYA